jgi:flagellar protein FliO/FliZ
MSDALGSLAWFIAVLALIPLALWMLKRSAIGARLSQGPMKTVASLALSPSQRVVTVEVGSGDERRWLVLGVAQGGVSLLYTLTPAPESAPPDTPAEGFAQLLSRLKDGGGQRAP